MTRLFNFVRRKEITDIGGNIYYLKDILPILSKLSCFGIIVEQLIKKIEYLPNLKKIKNDFNESHEKYNSYYDEIDEKYSKILKLYNKLNPENKIYQVKKKCFKIKSHYTEEEKEIFKKEYLNFQKDKNLEGELEDRHNEAREIYDKAFGYNEECWNEIIFFKFIQILLK